MVWIQYNIANGARTGWNTSKVDDTELAALGRAQISFDGDPSGKMIDITSGAVIDEPPPPSPPADMLTHIFNALVQQGWIDPSIVDQSILTQANASLKVTGAKPIAVPTNPSSSLAPAT